MARARIGQLDRRLTIQVGVANVSSTGAPTVTYQTIANTPTVWARVESLSGGAELDEAGRLQPRSFWRVTIRRRDDLTRSHRFLFGDRMLYIKDLGDDDRRSPLMECQCTEYPS